MRFPSTRRERGGGKKREAREHAHGRENTRARPRVYACTRVHASVCTGRKRTYVQKESRELETARDGDGERKGEARETDRVYVPPEECTRLLVL